MLDFLISGGTVFDGTGGKPYRGDVGIRGDRVVEIGELSGASARTVIKAENLAVAPGFIDIHSHHDWYLLEKDPFPRFASFLLQGVTSCVVGNCGWTAAPCLPGTKPFLLRQLQSMGPLVEDLPWDTTAQYFDWLEKRGLPCNIAQLAGHGAIRIAVMGDNERPPTSDEIGRAHV